MPKRLCTEPKCGNETVYRGYCRTHARQRNRETSPNKHIYNTERWRMLRRAYLREHPICERCDQTLATEVHHRIDIQDGGSPWEWKNLEALCKSDHSRHTRAQQT